jgi:hypothetical protein
VALAYAREIAISADLVHHTGRAHGGLSPARISVGSRGPILPVPNGMSRLATPASDLHDFGLLLHQMLTGLDPAGYFPPVYIDDDLEPTPEMVRSAALRLMERCCRAPGQTDMRHVSTELRLLQIMASSFEAEEVEGRVMAERPAGPVAKPSAPNARKSGCPSCGSPAYFPSQHLTLLEKILAVADLKTYRCYACCQRFINVFGLHLPRPEKR